MSGLLGVMFWIWTAVSLLVFLRRLFTTKTLRTGGKRPGSESLNPTEQADKIAAFEAKLALREPPSDRPVDDQVDREPPAPTPDVSHVPQAQTLAEALKGIQMPADLSPVVVDDVDPRRLICTTTTASPETVTGALADELERLDFELHLPDEHSITAERPGVTVHVRVLGAAKVARPSLGDHIAMVPDHAVVTEFELH